jgi:hypothetical protein
MSKYAYLFEIGQPLEEWTMFLEQTIRMLKGRGEELIEDAVGLHQARIDVLNVGTLVEGRSFLRIPGVSQYKLAIWVLRSPVDVQDMPVRDQVQLLQCRCVVEG